MKTLREDLNSSLDKVERKWIRRPVTIFFLILIIPLGALLGIIDRVEDWFEKCW